jgi:type III secretory pathway component EscV
VEAAIAAPATRNTTLLTEYVRQAIRRTVVKPYLARSGDLPAWFVDPSIEQAVEGAVQPGLFFLAHNEAPPGIKVQSLGNIQ